VHPPAAAINHESITAVRKTIGEKSPPRVRTYVCIQTSQCRSNYARLYCLTGVPRTRLSGPFLSSRESRTRSNRSSENPLYEIHCFPSVRASVIRNCARTNVVPTSRNVCFSFFLFLFRLRVERIYETETTDIVYWCCDSSELNS